MNKDNTSYYSPFFYWQDVGNQRPKEVFTDVSINALNEPISIDIAKEYIEKGNFKPSAIG